MRVAIIAILTAFLPNADFLMCYNGTSRFHETKTSVIPCIDRQCVKVIDMAGGASYGCDDMEECGRAFEYTGVGFS
uniref:Uncharacterized protein n=1 Tax=Caenorhabditis japonica TaxID=281687 RepID=A0A8R1EEF9_CAEJA